MRLFIYKINQNAYEGSNRVIIETNKAETFIIKCDSSMYKLANLIAIYLLKVQYIAHNRPFDHLSSFQDADVVQLINHYALL